MSEQQDVPPTRPDGILDQPADAFARPMIDDLERRALRSRGRIPPELQEALAPRFGIDAQIGAGGMATVFRAFDSALQRHVAIKVLRPELTDGLTLDRFEREIAIAARLDHPRIVPLYDRGSAAGLLYYVMRFVDGESLRDRLERQKQLEIREAIAIARHVAEALDHAHGQRVVHRDIKPENILIDDNGAYVADFGIARLQDAVGAEVITRTGMAVGTVPYMSPEQIEASRELDGRSDVYALTCVLYEMLAGEPPYTGRTAQDVFAKHLAAAIPDLSVVRPTVNGQMQHVIATGLRKNAVDRIPSARQLVDAFERAHAARTDRAPSATPRPLTVGVLPFANLSGDVANDYLGDGIADELISALIRAGRLRVLARGSTFVFKGHQRDIREIGEVLGATHLLEGSVRIAGRRLRATAQLVDVGTGIPLWSERYDRDLEDVFAVQDEITGAIAARLRRELEVEKRADTGEHVLLGAPARLELESVIVEPESLRKSMPIGARPPSASRDPLRDKLVAAMGDRYEIQHELGRGALAVVYRAVDTALDRPVAIKTLIPERSSESHRKRLLRETQVAMKLDHPNIVPIYAVKETREIVCFVMRFVDGGALPGVQQRFSRLQLEGALVVIRDVARALAYAHEHSVLHHNLIPANILLSHDGSVLVSDFSLAVAAESENLTATGATIGTPTYMSPERFHAKGITGRSDQYALGVIAYEILAGQAPFVGDTFSALITGHLFEEPERLSDLAPDVPASVADTVHRMLRKDPDERFPDCSAVVEALGALDEGAGRRQLSEMVRYVGQPELFAGSIPTRAFGGSRTAPKTSARVPRSRSPVFTSSAPGRRASASLFSTLFSWIASLFRSEPRRAPEPAVESREEPSLVMMRRPETDVPGRVASTDALTPAGYTAVDQKVVRQRFPAYDAYLRGRFMLNFESSHESIADAVRHFDAAIQGNASFAPAYAARALAVTMLARAGVLPPSQARSSADEDATAALAFDPSLAEGHVARALVSIFFDRDRATALASLDKAIASSAVYAEAYMWRGFALNWMEGQPAAAIEALDRALDLDPLSLVTRVELAFAYLLKGDTDQALREADEAVASGLLLGTKPRGEDRNRNPETEGFAAAHYARGVVLAELGRFDEALVEAREALRLGGRQTMHLAFVGYAHAKRGDADSARGIIAKLEGRAQEGAPVSTALATVYAGLEDRERTLAALREALNAREVNLVLVPSSPQFAALRQDPEFRNITNQLSAVSQ